MNCFLFPPSAPLKKKDGFGFADFHRNLLAKGMASGRGVVGDEVKARGEEDGRRNSVKNDGNSFLKTWFQFVFTTRLCSRN